MKNNIIEFYRFIFILCICIMHFFTNYYGTLEIKYFGGGYLPVEFFFILSGFLLALKVDKSSENKSVFDFFLSKLKRFYPIYICALLIIFIYYSIINNVIITEPIKFLLEILILSAFYGPLNPPSWFLGVLIFDLPIIYFFMIRYKNLFYILSPYIVIFIYINILYQYKILDVWYQNYGLLTIGVYRGIAGILLGCISYKIYDKLKKNRLNKSVIFFIECMCLFILLKIIFGAARNINDFIVPFLFSILIITAFLPQIKYVSILNTKYISFLGNLTLSIFLNHWIVFQVIFRYLKFLDLKYLIIIYIILIICWSYFLNKVLNNILRKVFK